MLQSLILLTLGLSLIIWILFLLFTIWNYRKMPNLSMDYNKKSYSKQPLITVIIPTRNEENRVKRCIETLKLQTYPNLEFLIVDASTDKTIDVIKSIIKDDNRFKIIKQKELPPGWIGKPHALQQGSEYANGQWLLFIDADTYYDPNIISKTVEYVLKNDLDMLSLAANNICESFWEKVIQPIPLAGLSILSMSSKINNPKSKMAIAYGPFILIKHSVFKKIDGYNKIKSHIGDDVELAKLVKSSGYKIGLANGYSLMKIRMYQGFKDIWEGWSKNIFLGITQKREIKRKPVLILFLIIGLLGIFVLMVFPTILLITSIIFSILTKSTYWADIFVISFLTWLVSILGLAYAQYCYKIGKKRYAPLSLFLGGLIIMGIFFNSAYNVILKKGIKWRGRTYYSS